MTWANFYLICFVVGFAFSLISFLSGGTNWHFHFPHWHGGTPALRRTRRARAGCRTCAGTRGSSGSARHGGNRACEDRCALYEEHPSRRFNFVTLTAFLAWFGGTGYLLTRYSSLWFVLGLGIALASGLVGGGIVFLFLSKVLTSEEEDMDPADYEMVGVLGRMSISIREGGTGELIYSQAGTRRVCGARSESGAAIAKGVEVVVTRYDRGIAYVRPWTEMSGEEAQAESTAP